MWRIFRKMLSALMLFVFFAFLFVVMLLGMGSGLHIFIVFFLIIGVAPFILLAVVLLDS